MAQQSGTARPKYFWPLIALAAGILIGLIIGWGIWPVSYKNTLPQDLRPAERDQYLSMVAESFAASGDLQAAQEKLQTWPREELAKALSNLQERLVGTNARLAGDVQSLGTALNVVAPVTSQPVSPAPAAASGIPWKTICTSALWVLLVLVGVVGLTWLFRSWRAARSRPVAPAITGTTPASVRPASSSAEEIARQARSARPQPEPVAAPPQWEPEPEFYEVQGGVQADLAPSTQTRAARATPPASAAPVVQASAAISHSPAAPPEPSRRVPAPASSPTFDRLGDYVAIYQMGEPGYDEAFDLNDAVDGYMGQCGVQLTQPAGRDRDQADSLQAWLWDSSDPDTKTVVLMSEGTYRDTARRSEVAGATPVVQVRPGAEFELESHDLLLRGRVEKVDFTDQDPPRSVFAELQVRMQVYRKR